MKSQSQSKSWNYLLLVAPVIFAGLALNISGFVYKSGTAGTGILILMLLYFRRLPQAKDIILLMLAFAFSITGDWFLSNMHGNATMFVYGIVFYLFAHLGYLFYALLNGKIPRTFTFILLAGFLVFFVLVLYPSIEEKILMVAVLFYLIISCVSLGAAVGIKTDKLEKWSYVFGIFLILFSDTIIAFKEFVGYKELNYLILPTYYLAHISVIFSLVKRKITEFRS